MNDDNIFKTTKRLDLITRDMFYVKWKNESTKTTNAGYLVITIYREIDYDGKHDIYDEYVTVKHKLFVDAEHCTEDQIHCFIPIDRKYDKDSGVDYNEALHLAVKDARKLFSYVSIPHNVPK